MTKENKDAEEASLKAEKRYYTLFEGANDAIFIMKEGRFVECNHKTLEVFGCGRNDDIVGHTPWEFSPPQQPDGRDSKEKVLEFISAALNGMPQRFYWKHLRKDKTLFDTEVSLSCFEWEDRKFMQAIVRDITEQKQAEEELRKSEEKYRILVENAGEAIFVAQEGMLKFANDKTAEIIGYSKEELTSRPFTEFIHSEDRKLVLDRHVKRQTGSVPPPRYSFRIVTPSGDTRWVDLNVVLIEWEGKPASLNFLNDITESRQAGETLRLNQSRLACLLELSQMSAESETVLTDFTLEKAIELTGSRIGYLAFMNPDESVLTMYSWSRTAMRECAIDNKPIKYPVEETGLWGEAVRQRRPVITNDYQSDNPLKKGYPEGHVSVHRHLNIPLFDGDRIVLVAGVGNKNEPYGNDDIEQLTLLMDGMWKILKANRIEKELNESEGRYRLIAKKMIDIIWTADLSFRTTYISPSVEKALGFTQEERLVMDPAETMTPESFTQAYLILAKELERDLDPDVDPDRTVKMDVEYYHKNGSRVWFENIMGALRDEKGAITGIYGVSHDITERKRAEEELLQEQQRFHNLIHNAPFGMLVVDKYGKFNYANPKFTEIFGYNLSDIPDGKRWFKLAYPDPEYRKQVISAWIEDSSLYGPGEKRPRIFEVTCKDGSRKIIHFIPVQLVTGENLAACEDITERITLEDQLRQAQKMESVGRLAGGVAHDFNNMLQAIMGYAELALLKISMGSPADSYLAQIKQAAQRSADLVRQLLAFARKQTVSPRVLDLNATVADMIKILQRLIGEEIDLVWKPGTDTWAVKMDPAQIDQILANLLVNARDSISGAGTVSIETENAVIDGLYCRPRPGFTPGKYAVLSVSDTGSGMDKETLSHIFEPFFTTKDIGSGTGLGLSTVYGIVKQNCGFIDVISEPYCGTTFKIYLPSCHDQAERKIHVQEKITCGGAETVLVVEDERMLLEFVCSILKEHGYNVLSALTPADALSLLRGHSSPVHLLITDVVMPGMNGLELKNAVLNIHPETRTLYMSGHPADVIARHGVLEKGTMFLQKPFLVAELTEKVRQALEE
jgi:PAS domain S-box-containing protein